MSGSRRPGRLLKAPGNRRRRGMAVTRAPHRARHTEPYKFKLKTFPLQQVRKTSALHNTLTMSTNNTLSARLAAFKSKTADLIVTDVKVPDSSADVLTLFESNSAARADSANEWTIDVFPNMIPIMMFVLLIALQHAGLTDHRNHAKSSVATIALYHSALVYGFFLLNDMYVRPSPSAHARSWLQSSPRSLFASFLLSLPVPDVLVPILAQFYASETERSRNVFVVPSAAGFAHSYHFGKFIPLTAFAAIHDCTATMPGNSPRLDVLKDLFNRDLYTIDQANPVYQFSCSIADIIGVTMDQVNNNTFNFVNSKFYQIFTAVFNPVLFRDFQRRSTLATLSLKAPEFDSMYPNAYDVLFGYSSANLRELRVVLQAVSSVLSGRVQMKKNLGQVISDASGAEIFRHGYSTYALPTWSSNFNLTSTQIDAMTKYTHVSEEDRATDISFLTAPTTRPSATNSVAAVSIVDENGTPATLPSNRKIRNNFPFSRVYDTTNSRVPWPSLTRDLVLFNDAIHTTPRVLVLDILGDKTISAHLATLAGKIIESFELDGTTIEVPNVDKPLGLQNCLFADSAIPYKYVIPALLFHPRSAGSILPPLRRAPPNPQPRLPASSLLRNRLAIANPIFTPTTIDSLPLQVDFPGMTTLPHVDWIRYAQSFIGLRTCSGASNSTPEDAVPGMDTGRLYVFSPYSYTPYEDDDEPTPDLSESRSYFLTNLRTLFGTDYNLIEVKHPYEAMPVV
jgi:hypothetical protein